MSALLQPAIAFVATIFLIVLLRPLAQRVGLIDLPGERKDHSGEIPLIGGLAIFFAILISLIGADRWGGYGVSQPEILSFVIAAGVLVLVGALDDRLGLSPAVRFAAQITAALIMVYGGGVILENLGVLTWTGNTVALGWLAVPFTVFVTVGMINAINMADGLDGLSGNLTLVLLAGLGIANSIWGDADHLEMLNIVSAAVAGFLVFNQRNFWLNKAWVFLGDAGSMMLGLSLAWAAIDLADLDAAIVSPAAILWFLAIPVFDTVSLMCRRVARGQSPFHADSEHLHHLFVKAGFTVGETIAYICFLAACGCIVGLIVTWYRVAELWVALAFVFTGLLYLWLVQSSWSRRSFLGRPLSK